MYGPGTVRTHSVWRMFTVSRTILKQKKVMQEGEWRPRSVWRAGHFSAGAHTCHNGGRDEPTTARRARGPWHGPRALLALPFPLPLPNGQRKGEGQESRCNPSPFSSLPPLTVRLLKCAHQAGDECPVLPRYPYCAIGRRHGPIYRPNARERTPSRAPGTPKTTAAGCSFYQN